MLRLRYPKSYEKTKAAMKNYLLGCDWGTSSFRLRLMAKARLLSIYKVRRIPNDTVQHYANAVQAKLFRADEKDGNLPQFLTSTVAM